MLKTCQYVNKFILLIKPSNWSKISSHKRLICRDITGNKSCIVSNKMLFAAWYGKCVRDSMWASIWCWTSRNARDLHATFLDNLVGWMHLPLANLHLCWANPYTPWTRTWNCWVSWNIHYSIYPSDVFSSNQFPYPKVLAGTNQSGFPCMARFCSPYFACDHSGCFHESSRFGYHWCCCSLLPNSLDHCFGSSCLCDGLVRGWLERVLLVSLQGSLGLCQIVSCFSNHALPRGLVFHDLDCAHWSPWQSYYCCWISFNMVSHVQTATFLHLCSSMNDPWIETWLVRTYFHFFFLL